MTDDLESRMRRACTLGAAIKLLDEGADEIVRLRARVRELEAERDALKQQAQIHAQEANTANATIAECYQACTGGTGEPGNWRGAAPVRALRAENERLRGLLQRLIDANPRYNAGERLQLDLEAALAGDRHADR